MASRSASLRRRLASELRAAGQEDQAATLGKGMWAIRKKPENLTTGQRTALAGIDHGPSNGRAEALNAQLNALITRARGFRSAGALIAMADFVYGGLCPDSPY
jgi:transposase